MEFDLVSLLNDQGVFFTYNTDSLQADWININCPLSSCPGYPDTKFHGGFNLSDGFYNCWKCGKHQLDYVLRSLLHLSYAEVHDLLFKYSGRASVLYALNRTDKKEKNNRSVITVPGTDLKEIHRKYLIKRGFDPDFIQNKYKVTGTGPVGDFKFRLIIPVIYLNTVVSFLGRDVTNQQSLRYKNLSETKSHLTVKQVLYNLDNCGSINNYEWVGVVEGVFDVWRMGDCFCSPFGTTMTDYQIKLLSEFKKVYFLFDSEKKAQKSAKKHAGILSALGCSVFTIDLGICKDPAELSDRRAQHIRRKILEL